MSDSRGKLTNIKAVMLLPLWRGSSLSAPDALHVLTFEAVVITLHKLLNGIVNRNVTLE